MPLQNNNISFIVAYKKDTEEREKNLNLFKDYYSRIVPGCEIIVEETKEQTFNKCRLYNSGAVKASNNILCFIDSDIFISQNSIKLSCEKVHDSNKVMIGYSGFVLHMSYMFKESIKSGFQYSDLIKDVQPYKTIRLRDKTDLYWVEHTHSIGGCLFMNKQCFKDINGFNPNFVGWGHEDDEIIYRSHGLGKSVERVGRSQDSILIHLPHLEVDAPEVNHTRSNHSSYDDNIKELLKV
jgi:predicted glycosyltransferase involved in capsule biosynthesis